MKLRCEVCGLEFHTPRSEYKGIDKCSHCMKLKEPSDERIRKVAMQTFEILKSQGRIDDYEEIFKEMLANKYTLSKYNATELALSLEMKRRGWKFEHQRVYIRYRLDFYLPAFRLNIEVDERYHDSKKQYQRDRKRDSIVGNVIRIREQTIRGNVKEAANQIYDKVFELGYYMDNDKFKKSLSKTGMKYREIIEKRF